MAGCMDVFQVRCLGFFFFKQKTAYEISGDWSSDVCSSDLGLQPSRLLHPWDFPGKSTVVGCHCLLRIVYGLGLFCQRVCGCQQGGAELQLQGRWQVYLRGDAQEGERGLTNGRRCVLETIVGGHWKGLGRA